MTKLKFRPTVLEGNIERLKELAEEYGFSVEDFLFMLSSIDWYCLSRDVVMQKKIEGKEIPKELEYLEKPGICRIDKENSERLEMYLDPAVELGLKVKQRQYGFRTMGQLIDKICSEPLQLMNPDLINGIKLKNGGKK